MQLLIEDPEWLFDVNRKLRELQGSDPLLGEVLAPLNEGDFSRIDHKTIFKTLVHALFEGDDDPIDYLYAHLPAELAAIVDELRVPTLDTIQQMLPHADFHSIVRDQERLHSLPAPDVNDLVREALTLRLNQLERQRQELYFLQQEMSTINDEEAYATGLQISAIARAHKLIDQVLKSAARV